MRRLARTRTQTDDNHREKAYQPHRPDQSARWRWIDLAARGARHVNNGVHLGWNEPIEHRVENSRQASSTCRLLSPTPSSQEFWKSQLDDLSGQFLIDSNDNLFIKLSAHVALVNKWGYRYVTINYRLAVIVAWGYPNNVWCWCSCAWLQLYIFFQL